MKKNKDIKTKMREPSRLEMALSEAARDFAKEMSSIPNSKKTPVANSGPNTGKLWYLLNPKASDKS